MTQNRLKNAFCWPKKFDDQIDQFNICYKKVGIYDQNRLKKVFNRLKIQCYLIF